MLARAALEGIDSGGAWGLTGGLGGEAARAEAMSLLARAFHAQGRIEEARAEYAKVGKEGERGGWRVFSTMPSGAAVVMPCGGCEARRLVAYRGWCLLHYRQLVSKQGVWRWAFRCHTTFMCCNHRSGRNRRAGGSAHILQPATVNPHAHVLVPLAASRRARWTSAPRSLAWAAPRCTARPAS